MLNINSTKLVTKSDVDSVPNLATTSLYVVKKGLPPLSEAKLFSAIGCQQPIAQTEANAEVLRKSEQSVGTLEVRKSIDDLFASCFKAFDKINTPKTKSRSVKKQDADLWDGLLDGMFS